jgi:putative colanic acid biosysnthesis UDP-glucose lipid carrier transferase
MSDSAYRDADMALAVAHIGNDGSFASVKRFLDLAITFLILLLLAPLFALIALALACEGSGPVFFEQTRTGLNGRRFSIYKFRTMRVLEDGERAVQCLPNDYRVTPVGRILRKFSLDELPQLFNVLAGDMSLVGPRPHPPALDRTFASALPRYMNRYTVKPGMTGLAQVLGFRGPTTTLDHMESRITADIDYIRNHSIILDLLILMKTVPAVLFRQNAF